MSTDKKKRTGQTGYEPNNLKRTHLFKIWLSEEEYQQLEKEALLAGASSLAKHARQILFADSHVRQQATQQQVKSHLELLAAINRIGNNINQIARALNQRHQMTPEMQSTLSNLQDKLNLILINKTDEDK